MRHAYVAARNVLTNDMMVSGSSTWLNVPLRSSRNPGTKPGDGKL
jgi:hypothetical protein